MVMKRYLLLLSGALLSLAMFAAPNFEIGKKYRIVCQAWGYGSIALGSNHGSSAYVYYDSNYQSADDHWWYIRKDGDGYTICNAQSGVYLTHYPDRIEGVAKGLVISTGVSNNRGRWTFTEKDGSYNIANVDDPTQWFNVRLDGTFLVGTYASHNGYASNEYFKFYDEAGNLVGEGNGEEGGSGEVVGNGYGITADGEYWEAMGLDVPVVYTTAMNNPVLYTIKNVRSNLTVYLKNSYLYLGEGQATKFYFTKNENGVNIYSEDHRCVTDYFSEYTENPLFVEKTTASANTNCWEVAFSHMSYSGYYIRKVNESWNATQDSYYQYWNDYSRSGTHFVGLYDLDGGSTFLFASADQRHIDHLIDNGIVIDGNEKPTGFNVYVDSLRINDKDLIYDQREKVYYFPLAESVREEGDFVGTVTWKNRAEETPYTLYIGSDAVDNSTHEIAINGIDATVDYPITLVAEDGATLGSTILRFTYLPIVEVGMPNCNGSYYTSGTIRVTDSNYLGYDSTYIAAFKYRGASAQNYEKKSYAIKMRDADGNSVDREFFGLRDDNNWILDAMAVDLACMRNRVSTDLWNDFATDPYHKKWEKKARTGTRGKFVEVLLNGSYHGLYCMTEKMDRKQLKLKKLEEATESSEAIIHGSLYKSYDWTYETMMGHEPDYNYYPQTAPDSYNNYNRRESWAGYEVKYPDYEEEPIDWAPLWNAINFVATSSNYDFDTQFSDYFDRPVVDDYYLFIELMLATDNHGKNMFYFNYDQKGSESKKIGIAPWDLDGVWGRRWNGSSVYTGADQDFANFIWKYEHGLSGLFDRLYESADINWYETLRERYAELRATHFDAEKLKQRFTQYAALFEDSRAHEREENRWKSLHSDILGDVDFICQWIDERIDFLDAQYDFDPTILGIQETAGEAHTSFNGAKGCLIVRSTKAQAITLYDASGKAVRPVHIPVGLSKIEGLAPGVYIAAGQKILVQ